MKSPSLTVKAHPLAGMGLAAGLLRRTVLHQLYKLRHGQLTLHHGDQQQLFGDLASPLKAEIHVLDAGLWGLRPHAAPSARARRTSMVTGPALT